LRRAINALFATAEKRLARIVAAYVEKLAGHHERDGLPV
jgi:hypothetical protein